MTELGIEQELNGKPRSQHRGRFWVAIVSATVGALVSSLAFKYSFKSNVIHHYRETVLPQPLTASQTQKNEPFDSEVGVSYFGQNLLEGFSKFSCSGSENEIEAWQDRLCVFYHTCYNSDTRRFNYFQLAQRKMKPIFYDSIRGMLYQFTINNGDAPFLSLSPGGGTPWAPVAVKEAYPVKNFTRLRPLHSLMQTRFADSNIAHGLWEDLGSVSYAMERMNVQDKNLVIMHATKIPSTPLFRTYHQYVIPALSKNPMVELETYVKSFKTKYVCFDRLIVGGQLSVFPRPLIKENHGREALFHSWRSKIIQYNGFDPNFVPQRHHITITNKSQSLWTPPGAKMHRAIANLEALVKFVRLTYPNISSEVVEWSMVPFNKQVEKLLNTTIFITPCGGVSLVLPLLPHGAHAIVMDYYVARALHGFQAGSSGSMEGALLNHFPHVRKQYYQVYGPQDYQFDYPGASDPREGSSIVVNMTRLQMLIDKALEEMEYRP